MIGIIDYGLGNLYSVLNALKKINFDAEIFSDPKKINNYSNIILPGVGSFKKGMNNLEEKNWILNIENYIQSGKPFLGICLGMQLLLSKGEEYGTAEGLDLIPGQVIKMQTDENYKIPHVGWNSLEFLKDHLLFKDIKKNIDFYFVHSYSCIVDNKDHIIANFEYGKSFTACIAKENVVGTQFHPEKSIPSGLTILKNFANWKI